MQVVVEQEIKSLVKVCLTILASLCYTYFIPSKIPQGKIRFLSLLPIFCLFAVLPLSLSAALPAGVVGLFATWIGNFKLLLFAFGLGPLSSGPPQNSLPLFIFTTCLPIKTNQYDHQTSIFHKPPKVPLNLPTKVLLFAILVALTDYSYTKKVHPKILLAQYCCALYLFLDVIVGLSNVIMRTVLGFELESPSNEPYLSTSLQDFWGSRWNLMVTNALRHTVYKPARSATESLFGPKWAPLPAVLAAFLVSGLMHELIFFYMTRATPTWEVTWYFVLHGVCLVVEFGVKKALSGRWRLHWVVSTPLTIGFVAVTATWLFFPPITRNGVDVRANEESKEMIHFVKDKLKCVWFHKIKGLTVF